MAMHWVQSATKCGADGRQPRPAAVTTCQNELCLLCLLPCCSSWERCWAAPSFSRLVHAVHDVHAVLCRACCSHADCRHARDSGSSKQRRQQLCNGHSPAVQPNVHAHALANPAICASHCVCLPPTLFPDGLEPGDTPACWLALSVPLSCGLPSQLPPQIGSIMDKPGYWLQILGAALPAASTYFLNYCLVGALSSNFSRFIW